MRFVVKGSSMTPTFHEGDRLWVSTFFYKLFQPKAGDIVIVKDPRNEKLLLKRITKIKSSKYFVSGDNPKASTDSRHFGEVTKDLIMGKVLFCYTRSTKGK